VTSILLSFALFLVCLSLSGYGKLVGQIRERDRSLEINPLGFPDLLVCIVLSAFFAYLAVLSSTIHANAPLKVDQVIPGSLMLMIIAAGVAGFIHLRQISLGALLGLGRAPVWRAVLLGIGLLLLALPILMCVSAIIAQHLPKELSDEQQLVHLFQEEAHKGQFRGIATILIAAIFLAPPTEEFLFRGYFYPTFKRYMGRIGSALLTAALFALLHANLASAGGLFVLALCLTVAYEWSGSLLVPMTMHATFNTLSLVLLYQNAQAKP
jgi:membrane protease YdiL (CAAX protease family)